MSAITDNYRCPYCGAEPGETCRNRNGTRYHGGVHRDREGLAIAAAKTAAAKAATAEAE